MSEALFDLTLTEEQLLTRDSLKRFSELELRKHSRASDEKKEVPNDFYNKTIELGLSLMPIPEALGGAGMSRSPVSNVLNAEDLAYGDMSLALGSLTPLSFINTVLDNGTEEQIEKYLPYFTNETFTPATIALMEEKATFEPTKLSTKATKDGDNYIINGKKSLVILGKSAQFILVIADEEGVGPQAFIVEKEAEGLSYEDELYMGLNPIEKVSLSFENVCVTAKAKLGESNGFDLQRLVDLARIGTCALSVGTAKAVLDYVIPYVNERIAFGEPISHRQAIAFMVANIKIELDAMQLMTYRAASKAEQGLDFHKEAYLARVFCAEKSMEIGTNGIQLLGGHGFCREHMVELWYRNLRSVAILEGACVI